MLEFVVNHKTKFFFNFVLYPKMKENNSLVPRPLLDFISQPTKSWVGPGNEAKNFALYENDA